MFVHLSRKKDREIPPKVEGSPRWRRKRDDEELPDQTKQNVENIHFLPLKWEYRARLHRFTKPCDVGYLAKFWNYEYSFGVGDQFI